MEMNSSCGIFFIVWFYFASCFFWGGGVCEPSPDPEVFLFTVNLTPTTSTERQLDVQEGAELAKSRKRVFPETHPPGPDSARDPYSYCNTPNGSEQAWEGETARSPSEDGARLMKV